MCDFIAIVIQSVINVKHSPSRVAENSIHTLFNKTFKNNLWWVAGQFVVQIIVLMGWLPIIGL